MKQKDYISEKSKSKTTQLLNEIEKLQKQYTDALVKINLQKSIKTHQLKLIKKQISQLKTIINMRIKEEINEAKAKR